ncbi:PREDICTED: LRR receptor serine/threonine- [Prunus dulcis]|uniref:PREDICTED: LRR receptor serine/threonine n=1 Tax=Prunus dulcis TaxID=3755 RepID=A0A5E4GNN9_PRUDU|nr:PREDICTED: LRR receptor serine/threonine- [Prunus dulcis]
MSSDTRSQSQNSQVSLYLQGGFKVHKERFVANLHRVTIKAQFKTWRATFDSIIPKDVHVKLALCESKQSRRYNYHVPSLLLPLGFTFSLSKFFWGGVLAMEYALS